MVLLFVDCVLFNVGNSVASVKSISLGILRCDPQDRPVCPVKRLTSSPYDIVTEAFGDRVVWYFDIAAEYLDVPDLLEPRDPVGLNFLATCGLYLNAAVAKASLILVEVWCIYIYI